MRYSVRKRIDNLSGIERDGYGKVLRSCPGCIEDAANILSEKLGE